jgi:Predicted transcriptional regulators
MNNLKFRENLVGLRKEKNVTQQQLADHIGVAKTSVSKWETGTTLPDIESLPAIAAYFDVTVDDLLGYEPQLTSEQIRHYYHSFAKDFAERPFDEVMEDCRALINKYYSCYPLLENMVILMINHAQAAGDPEKTAAVMQEASRLCVRIIEYCSDNNLRVNAESFKAMLDLQQGKAGDVIEALEPDCLNINKPGDMKQLLTMAYLQTGDMANAEKAAQIGLYSHAMNSLGFCNFLLMIPGSNERYSEIIKRADKIIDAFDVDTLNPNAAAVYYFQAAAALCSADEIMEEDVFEKLEQYVHAVKNLFRDGIVIHGDKFFFKLDEWFEDLELGTEAVRDRREIVKSAVAAFSAPQFSRLSDPDRLSVLKKQLETL